MFRPPLLCLPWTSPRVVSLRNSFPPCDRFAMKLKLISVDSWCAQRKIVAAKLPITIGRSDETDVRIEDRWASREHCQIEAIDGTLVVRDLRSRHGTFINGHPVTAGHLMPGDKLTIGMSSFVAQYRCGRKHAPVCSHASD